MVYLLAEKSRDRPESDPRKNPSLMTKPDLDQHLSYTRILRGIAKVRKATERPAKTERKNWDFQRSCANVVQHHIKEKANQLIYNWLTFGSVILLGFEPKTHSLEGIWQHYSSG